MTRTIAQRELRNDNAKVIEAVTAGESFIVTRNGVAVAELRPVRPRRPALVPKTELAGIAAAGPRVDAARLRTDLDRFLDPSL